MEGSSLFICSKAYPLPQMTFILMKSIKRNFENFPAAQSKWLLPLALLAEIKWNDVQLTHPILMTSSDKVHEIKPDISLTY
jgi:hypothetical protein